VTGAVVRATVRVQVLIHARPCARIARAAGRHPARAVVRSPRGEADPRSVLELLLLEAQPGELLTIEARGPDAQALVDAIADELARAVQEE